jgi:hypothetical protein
MMIQFKRYINQYFYETKFCTCVYLIKHYIMETYVKMEV